MENSMGDAFWPTALPGIWKNVRANLKQEDEDEDEDEDDGYDDDVHKISSSQGMKCPSKRARSS